MEKKKVGSKTTKKAIKSTVKKTTKTVVKKEAPKTSSKKKKKKGFTLIELLAVIIILGILMIIAIPSVTSYISNSRKSAYVDTAKEVVAGTRNAVNEGKLGMYSTDTTYYIPYDYIKSENGTKSPYGEFVYAYIGVIYDGKGYAYYWISVDDAGQGVDEVTPVVILDEDDIKSDINALDIKQKVDSTGIGGRKKVLVLENGSWVTKTENAQNNVPEEGGSGSGGGNTGPRTAAQQISSLSGLRDAAGAKRFYGANPNNYVSFNNGQLWRIIGVYGEKLKIIKAEPIGNQPWGTNGNYTWDPSDLRNYLYNTYYNSLSSDAKNMIDNNASWINGGAYRMDTASEAYDRAKTSVYTGKIGVIATYEYLYAGPDSCLSKGGHQIDGCDNWIFNVLVNNGQVFRAWTINKDYTNMGNSMLVYRANKQVDVHGTVDACGVTPVVYLKSSVKITGGTGTSGDPYTLSM